MQVESSITWLGGEAPILPRVLLASVATIAILVLRPPATLLLAMGVILLPLSALEVASIRRRRGSAPDEAVLAA